MACFSTVGIAGDRDSGQARGVHPAGRARGDADVALQPALRARGVLVAEAPHHHRGMVVVARDRLAQHPQCAGADRRDVEERALHPVHRDLGPHQDAVAVGELQLVGAQRVMRARDRGSEIAQVLEHLPHLAPGEGCASGERVFVEGGAAQGDLAAVQLDPAEPVHLQAADPRAGPVTLHDAPAPIDQEQRHLVEPRVAGLPQARVADPHPRPEPGGAEPANAPRPQAQRPPAEPSGHPGALHAAGDVADPHIDRHRGGAPATAQLRAHEGMGEVEFPNLAQVDLAQDPVVVPPAALERTGLSLRERRDVIRLPAAVDLHDEAVHAPVYGPGAQLEGEIRAHVRPEQPAIEPHPSRGG